MASHDFTGGVFSPDLPGGRAGARLELSPSGIVARVGELRFWLEHAECELSLGGASGRMLSCRCVAKELTFFCEDPAFRRELERVAGSQLAGAFQRLAIHAKRQGKRRTRWAACLTLAAALSAGVVYLAGPLVVHASLWLLPVSLDRRLGDLAYANMEKAGPTVSDAVVVSAVQAVVDRLQPHAGAPEFEFRVSVVEAPLRNAYCLPGGRIVVYTGLIAHAQRPAHLAGVLAHEIAHATHRHGMSRLVRAAGVVALFQLALGDLAGLGAIAAELAQTGLILSYGREQETEADLEGIRLLHASGIDPRGLGEFFELIEQEQGDAGEGLTWLSSHPQLPQRRLALEQRRLALGPSEKQPFGFDWQKIRQRARQPITADSSPKLE